MNHLMWLLSAVSQLDGVHVYCIKQEPEGLRMTEWAHIDNEGLTLPCIEFASLFEQV